jgi:hypothetical protein
VGEAVCFTTDLHCEFVSLYCVSIAAEYIGWVESLTKYPNRPQFLAHMPVRDGLTQVQIEHLNTSQDLGAPIFCWMEPLLVRSPFLELWRLEVVCKSAEDLRWSKSELPHAL